MRTLHCLQAAFPPQGEGIAIPESNKEDSNVFPLSTVLVRESSLLILAYKDAL